MRLELLQLPPLPLSEPARRWQQQEDIFTEEEEKNEELETQFFCIFEDHASLEALEKIPDLIDEIEKKEKFLQKKSSENHSPVSFLEEIYAFVDAEASEKEQQK